MVVFLVESPAYDAFQHGVSVLGIDSKRIDLSNHDSSFRRSSLFRGIVLVHWECFLFLAPKPALGEFVREYYNHGRKSHDGGNIPCDSLVSRI